MTTPLFPPPPVFALPLSKGADLHVTFEYEAMVVDENGDPVLTAGQPQYVRADYPAGATVTLTIDTEPPVVGTGAITGPDALVHVDHTVTDAIARPVLWRSIMTLADGTDIPLCNGKTMRADGA